MKKQDITNIVNNLIDSTPSFENETYTETKHINIEGMSVQMLMEIIKDENIGEHTITTADMSDHSYDVAVIEYQAVSPLTKEMIERKKITYFTYRYHKLLLDNGYKKSSIVYSKTALDVEAEYAKGNIDAIVDYFCEFYHKG